MTGEALFTRPLAPGKHHIVFDFKYDGPGLAKGGTGVLSVDGHELSKKTIERTIPLLMSIDETFDVGADTRTPVDDSYEVPFRFTGTIDKLTFDLGPSQIKESDKPAIDEGLKNPTTDGREPRAQPDLKLCSRVRRAPCDLAPLRPRE